MSESIVINALRYFRLSPITHIWLMYLQVANTFSIAAGAIFFPPAVMIKSFFRPVIRRNPSSSISPMLFEKIAKSEIDFLSEESIDLVYRQLYGEVPQTDFSTAF